ncbi:MAG: hypothetical protein LH660_20760 [Phormidesmis sp. CAN_BIN36]|nr:hypothetical protein [Phormidesmis sp. CAN_BIN36]
MQDKQKVTLYLPPELHRQLKIRAAVAAEAMSALAEKALIFYLTHPETVEQLEGVHGQTHRIYNCPECTSPVTLKDGEIVALGKQSSMTADEELPVGKAQKVGSAAGNQGEGELVPC